MSFAILREFSALFVSSVSNVSFNPAYQNSLPFISQIKVISPPAAVVSDKNLPTFRSDANMGASIGLFNEQAISFSTVCFSVFFIILKYGL
jgi:hypothetical protein